jgi:hypothetical protein
MTEIPSDLLGRISDRANDPMRRTYMAGAQASAQPLDLGALMAGFQKHGAPGAQAMLGGALGNLQKLMGGLGGGALMMGPGGLASLGGEPAGPQPGAAPATEAALTSAEARIGRPLPSGLRQLYAIADGGFGPGSGLFALSELAERYDDMTREPFGPDGQDWPRNLLPLFNEDPVLLCLDLDSGGIVAWDPEEIEDEESEEDWQRSFKREQSSLAELMEQWLGKRTFTEEHGAG